MSSWNCVDNVYWQTQDCCPLSWRGRLFYLYNACPFHTSCRPTCPDRTKPRPTPQTTPAKAAHCGYRRRPSCWETNLVCYRLPCSSDPSHPNALALLRQLIPDCNHSRGRCFKHHLSRRCPTMPRNKACLACRLRKVKCDRRLPSSLRCSTCARLDQECSVPDWAPEITWLSDQVNQVSQQQSRVAESTARGLLLFTGTYYSVEGCPKPGAVL